MSKLTFYLFIDLDDDDDEMSGNVTNLLSWRQYCPHLIANDTEDATKLLTVIAKASRKRNA